MLTIEKTKGEMEMSGSYDTIVPSWAHAISPTDARTIFCEA